MFGTSHQTANKKASNFIGIERFNYLQAGGIRTIGKKLNVQMDFIIIESKFML